VGEDEVWGLDSQAVEEDKWYSEDALGGDVYAGSDSDSDSEQTLEQQVRDQLSRTAFGDSLKYWEGVVRYSEFVDLVRALKPYRYSLVHIIQNLEHIVQQLTLKLNQCEYPETAEAVSFLIGAIAKDTRLELLPMLPSVFGALSARLETPLSEVSITGQGGVGQYNEKVIQSVFSCTSTIFFYLSSYILKDLMIGRVCSQEEQGSGDCRGSGRPLYILSRGVCRSLPQDPPLEQLGFGRGLQRHLFDQRLHLIRAPNRAQSHSHPELLRLAGPGRHLKLHHLHARRRERSERQLQELLSPGIQEVLPRSRLHSQGYTGPSRRPYPGCRQLQQPPGGPEHHSICLPGDLPGPVLLFVEVRPRRLRPGVRDLQSDLLRPHDYGHLPLPSSQAEHPLGVLRIQEEEVHFQLWSGHSAAYAGQHWQPSLQQTPYPPYGDSRRETPARIPAYHGPHGPGLQGGPGCKHTRGPELHPDSGTSPTGAGPQRPVCRVSAVGPVPPLPGSSGRVPSLELAQSHLRSHSERPPAHQQIRDRHARSGLHPDGPPRLYPHLPGALPAHADHPREPERSPARPAGLPGPDAFGPQQAGAARPPRRPGPCEQSLRGQVPQAQPQRPWGAPVGSAPGLQRRLRVQDGCSRHRPGDLRDSGVGPGFQAILYHLFGTRSPTGTLGRNALQDQILDTGSCWGTGGPGAVDRSGDHLAVLGHQSAAPGPKESLRLSPRPLFASPRRPRGSRPERENQDQADPACLRLHSFEAEESVRPVRPVPRRAFSQERDCPAIPEAESHLEAMHGDSGQAGQDRAGERVRGSPGVGAAAGDHSLHRL
ncbi:hypothetical protein OJ252_905, partial [Cryptosporidium canis]